MRIAVAAPQVPFVRGGAEIFAETLVAELRARDHEAELVTVPFKWYPGTRVLDQAFLWRLLDLEADLVVATKFPAYCVRHPNKVAWVLHQFRQAYEYDRTDLGQFSESPEDRALRRKVHELDRVVLGEARKLFATSANVAGRIERSTGLHAEVMPHPPQQLPYRNDGYGDFVLSAGRLDRAKRVDLLLEAVAADESLRAVVVGDGPDRARLEGIANGRVEFTGAVSGERLAELYATCLGVYYAPIDEDFGMVPYEAFLSEKPVVTTTDAGGPLEIVADRRTGLVAEPTAASIGAALRALTPEDAARWGRAGKEIAERVTWDACIDRLLS